MTIDLYDKVRRDFDAMFRKQEAENGICSDEDVCAADREPPTKVGLGEDIPGERYFAGIAMPNPISQRDEE